LFLTQGTLIREPLRSPITALDTNWRLWSVLRIVGWSCIFTR